MVALTGNEDNDAYCTGQIFQRGEGEKLEWQE